MHCSSCLRAADTCLHGWVGQVTTMRQDLANRLLWERRMKVVGTLLLLSLSLALFLYLSSDGFTRPYLGNSHKLREGPATCPPNEYKTKPFTNRWVTEVKCVQFTPFFPSPYFIHCIGLYISQSWHYSEKKERNKIEPKCGNFSSFLHSNLSGVIVVNPVDAGWSAPVACRHNNIVAYSTFLMWIYM